MSGEALLLAPLPREFGAPDFSLAFLVGDEILEGGELDEPEAFDQVAVDKVRAREARDVIRCEVHYARGVPRAQVRDAGNFDCAF